MLSVFSFNRVRLAPSDDIDIEADLKSINHFDSDAEAIRHDFEKMGLDIRKAIKKYSGTKITREVQ